MNLFSRTITPLLDTISHYASNENVIDYIGKCIQCIISKQNKEPIDLNLIYETTYDYDYIHNEVSAPGEVQTAIMNYYKNQKFDTKFSRILLQERIDNGMPLQDLRLSECLIITELEKYLPYSYSLSSSMLEYYLENVTTIPEEYSLFICNNIDKYFHIGIASIYNQEHTKKILRKMKISNDEYVKNIDLLGKYYKYFKRNNPDLKNDAIKLFNIALVPDETLEDKIKNKHGVYGKEWLTPTDIKFYIRNSSHYSWYRVEETPEGQAKIRDLAEKFAELSFDDTTIDSLVANSYGLELLVSYMKRSLSGDIEKQKKVTINYEIRYIRTNNSNKSRISYPTLEYLYGEHVSKTKIAIYNAISKSKLWSCPDIVQYDSDNIYLDYDIDLTPYKNYYSDDKKVTIIDIYDVIKASLTKWNMEGLSYLFKILISEGLKLDKNDKLENLIEELGEKYGYTV